jgi:VWFA-related protein
MHPARLALGALLASAVSLALHAQQPTPTFRTGVDAIEVDAFVTDRAGKPVADLRRDEFQILEDGKPQTLSSFSLVNIPIVAPEPYSADAPVPDVATNVGAEGRIYAIALDEVEAADALKARHFLRDFIEHHFEANDIGIVVSVGRSRAIDAQDFTSNRRLLLAAIDHFQGWSNPDLAPDGSNGD